MPISPFKPAIYLKANCPFCLKIRIFLLESGQASQVEIRDFTPGTDIEAEIRAELAPHLAKVSFPAAQLEPGHYIAESDDIIARLADRSGHDPAEMTVYRNYINGAFRRMMDLRKENAALKEAASAA
ncbi:MAG: glutathione S-transferase N-terminal domain-containing protein [Qingshengfaniella sp.]